MPASCPSSPSLVTGMVDASFFPFFLRRIHHRTVAIPMINVIMETPTAIPTTATGDKVMAGLLKPWIGEAVGADGRAIVVTPPLPSILEALAVGFIVIEK